MPTKDEESEKLSKDFLNKMLRIVRHPGTEKAEFDCELCGVNTKFNAFTAFMYPDHSVKALCNPCGAKETLRLDYSNKN